MRQDSVENIPRVRLGPVARSIIAGNQEEGAADALDLAISRLLTRLAGAEEAIAALKLANTKAEEVYAKGQLHIVMQLGQTLREVSVLRDIVAFICCTSKPEAKQLLEKAMERMFPMKAALQTYRDAMQFVFPDWNQQAEERVIEHLKASIAFTAEETKALENTKTAFEKFAEKGQIER